MSDTEAQMARLDAMIRQRAAEAESARILALFTSELEDVPRTLFRPVELERPEAPLSHRPSDDLAARRARGRLAYERAFRARGLQVPQILNSSLPWMGGF